MTLWQPIETAPKDGTLILLWSEDARLEAYNDHPRWGGAYDKANEYEPKPAAPFVGFWSDDRYWQLAHYTAFSYAATHWMPLEPPPIVKGATTP